MTAPIETEEAHDIGVAAYVYLYPLVMMELTRRASVSAGDSQASGVAPMNRFAHLREFPSADFKTVVRPNFDTLYSSAWLDLTDGSVVVSTKAIPDGRFFQLPMYDMWTDAFASPGQRTTGTGAGSWAVVPPGWTGTLPGDADRIDAPTPYVWIIGRTQTNGPSDYDTVHRIQDGFTITPLGEASSAGQPAQPPAVTSFPSDSGPDAKLSPLARISSMAVGEYFDRALALLELHPPHLTDWSLLARMARIGLVPGSSFADLDPLVRSALATVATDAQASLTKALPGLANVVNGWQMNIDTMGVYGNSYVKRAIVTMIGLGANAAEDAIYPILQADADGKPIRGDSDYVLHFDADQLPPVHAFWSVTMYDGRGFQVANPIDRFAIGDRDELTYNPDGSLDLLLQHESPGPDKESNWLPSPSGRVGITMRLYAPKPSVLDGTWAPPAVRKVG